jgi:peptidyl-prolyl cis-trans isomerase C
MNVRYCAFLAVCAIAAAQQQLPQAFPQQQAAPPPPEQFKPDTVVARVGDRAITAAEAEKMVIGINPQWSAAISRDAKGVLNAILTMNDLAKEAEKEGMDKQSPTKESLEVLRKQILMQTLIAKKNNESTPQPEEVEKFYKENASKYEQVKLRVIYLSFIPGTPPAGSKSMTEEQAKAKASALVKQLRAGADFTKLVKENSEDDVSKARDGDFGTIRRGDSLPEDLKNAVFALKPGEVTDPIKQPNGYYLFRVEEKSQVPLSEVSSKVLEELRAQKFNSWLKGVQDKNQVTIEKPEFFQRMGASK